MISRRNFLKAAGLSSIAVTAGYITGKLTDSSKSVYYSVHGFIPANEKIITEIITAFKNKIKSNSKPLVIAEDKILQSIINQDSLLSDKNYTNNGNIVYKLKRLNKILDSDIIVSDGNNSIYSLNNFSYDFAEIRSDLKKQKAEYLFTAEYRESDLLSSFFKSNKKAVVIENEKGLADKIDLTKNYKNILIDGIQGKTGLNIENGIVRVYSSTCRHKICEHSFAAENGDVIACAPNKVLIKIELV